MDLLEIVMGELQLMTEEAADLPAAPQATAHVPSKPYIPPHSHYQSETPPNLYWDDKHQIRAAKVPENYFPPFHQPILIASH